MCIHLEIAIRKKESAWKCRSTNQPKKSDVRNESNNENSRNGIFPKFQLLIRAPKVTFIIEMKACIYLSNAYGYNLINVDINIVFRLILEIYI